LRFSFFDWLKEGRSVMGGLFCLGKKEDVDGRVKPGHDEVL